MAVTTKRIKMGDVRIVDDDGQGTNVVTLSGADESYFEIIETYGDGWELYLKEGVTLDYEVKNSYVVTLTATDTVVGGSASVVHTLNITDEGNIFLGSLPIPHTAWAHAHKNEKFFINRSSWQSRGLVLWLPFGAYPYATDKSLYGRDGTLVSAPGSRSDGPRSALLFGGSSYVTLDNIDAFKSFSGEEFAIAAWTKPYAIASSTFYGLYSHRQSGGSGGRPAVIAVYRYANDLWVHFRRNPITTAGDSDSEYPAGGGLTFIAENVFTVGVWTHIICGRTVSGEVYAFVDGVRYSGGSDICTGEMSTMDDGAKIGSGEDSANNPAHTWDGLLDDFRIYNHALSTSEAQTIYNQTRNGGYGDLASSSISQLHHIVT
jgi:hypothetical protein